MRADNFPPGYFPIEHTSKACGVAPATIRIWELRHRWPRPARLANGYRAYTQAQIDDLVRVRVLVTGGMHVSEVIVDGLPRWPKGGPAGRPDFVPLRFLPIPDASQPGALHLQIRDAIRERRAGALEWSLRYAATCLHPRERAAAAWLPALVGTRLWATAGHPLPNAEQLVAFIRSQLTPAAFDAIQADAEKATAP